MTRLKRKVAIECIDQTDKLVKVVVELLRYPETAHEAAASALARAAQDIVDGIRQQLALMDDKEAV